MLRSKLRQQLQHAATSRSLGGVTTDSLPASMLSVQPRLLSEVSRTPRSPERIMMPRADVLDEIFSDESSPIQIKKKRTRRKLLIDSDDELDDAKIQSGETEQQHVLRTPRQQASQGNTGEQPLRTSHAMRTLSTSGDLIPWQATRILDTRDRYQVDTDTSVNEFLVEWCQTEGHLAYPPSWVAENLIARDLVDMFHRGYRSEEGREPGALEQSSVSDVASPMKVRTGKKNRMKGRRLLSDDDDDEHITPIEATTGNTRNATSLHDRMKQAKATLFDKLDENSENAEDSMFRYTDEESNDSFVVDDFDEPCNEPDVTSSPRISSLRSPPAEPIPAQLQFVESDHSDVSFVVSEYEDELAIEEEGVESPLPSTSKKPQPTKQPSVSVSEDLKMLRTMGLSDEPIFVKPKPKPLKERKANVVSYAVKESVRTFKKNRVQYTNELFAHFNAECFDSQLPVDLSVTWSNKLRTTAGITRMSKKLVDQEMIYIAKIELSDKVLDSRAKLAQTLCHEMCHAAAFIVDHVSNPPHGACFKKWAHKAMRAVPGMEVSTCHSYAIHYKFKYECTFCKKQYGRHSKSLDTSRYQCGTCQSKIVLLGQFNADGTPMKKRKASKFALYVKSEFKVVKDANPSLDQGGIMKLLSAQYKAAQTISL